MHRFDEERPPVVDSRDYRDVAQSVFTLTLPHRADAASDVADAEAAWAAEVMATRRAERAGDVHRRLLG